MSKNNTIEAIYPLSPIQQGMLFHTLYAPQSGVYFGQLSCILHGGLHISAFGRAWQHMVDRHPIFRTLFLWEQRDKPLQAVRQRVRLPWEHLDWRRLPQTEQQKQLATFLQADRACGFDLALAPLMRLTLIQVAEDVYHFIWSFHLLLLDGWSMFLVLKEILACYEAFCHGQDLHLEHSHPYRDYIVWLQRQDLSQAETFWRQVLKGFTAPTLLGVDQAPGRMPSQEMNYAEEQMRLSTATTDALQFLARQHQLTLNTLVQGAWALLLSRYSGEEDVVFGATTSGRPEALVGVESMVGPFTNTLPVRVRLTPGALLLSWLRELQAQQVELRQYEYSPLVLVQGWSEVPRGRPLFESILVFENYPVDASLERGRSLGLRDVHVTSRSNYPLTVVAEPGSTFSLRISYDCCRFDAATIRRMLRYFQTLVASIVADPQQRFSDLPLLAEAERWQLLEGWNDTKTEYPQDTCVHALFEAQVERTPNAVAVVFEDEQLTYRQLNRWANQLAHRLEALGVGTEVLVGICMERSLEMVVGLLAILKAGGAYVPLDPAYPKERLAFLLQDAQVSVLLTQQRLVEGLPEHKGDLVCLDTNRDSIAQESVTNPKSSVMANNLAYVIYTSGSTGRPKGAMNTHQGVCNRLLWGQATYPLTEADCLLLEASFSFDASVWELFWPLSAGAKVILVPPGEQRNSTYLIQLIAAQQVTVAHFVPSMLKLLLEEPGFETCTSLRHVFCGGEVLSLDLQKRYFTCLKAALHNQYGLTEAAANSTYWDCQRGSDDPTVPIGRPIANTQIYLLDAHLHPVPIGVPGEVCIGGAGLGRGYLNRPEWTAERFIPHPFGPQGGERLYRTGDLARYQPDGRIEFLGRIDHQIKVRGFRIEVGEVEAVLRQHPAVQETVVVAREDIPSEKRLVAYIVAYQEPPPTISDLHSFLKEHLPEHMLPEAFVLLDALPVMSNGKVDRQALPVPSGARPKLQKAFVAPRDTLELQLTQIWEDILNVRPIGVTDNFFELGGHSLSAVRLMAHIHRQFGQDLPLATLFQGTEATIEHLASMLRQQTASPSRSLVVGIQPIGSKRPLFFVHPGGGTVFCYVDLARSLGQDQPFYGLQARGLEGEGEPYTQIEDMAAHYIGSLCVLQPQGPYLLGGWSMGGVVAFEMAQQLQGQGHEVALLALLDSRAPNSAYAPADDDDVTLLIEFAMDRGGLFARDLPLLYDNLRQLGPDEQLHYILEQAKLVNVVPPDTELLQIRRLFRVFKTNTQAARSYVPQVYPKQITLFQAAEQVGEVHHDGTPGWGELAVGGVELQIIPGNHYTMVRKPHVQVLAQRLKTYLDMVQGA